MHLLIVGTGMYVTGRNGSGVGTILASIFETSKQISIESVLLVSPNKKSKEHVIEATQRLNSKLETNCRTIFKALGNDSLNEFELLLSQNKFHACIISTPDHLHFSYARLTLKAGIHTLVVKPFTPTLNEGLELVQLQKENNVYGVVEFHKRWDETNLYIKRRLKENAFGIPLYISVEYSQRITIPSETFVSWVEQTNIFQYLGVHYVDLVYFLTGYLPKRVSAIGTKGILELKGIKAFDSIHATIIWQNPQDPNQELVAHYDTNWIDPSHTTAMSDQKYRLVGTQGRIDCNQKNRGLEEVTEMEGVKSINPYFSDFLPDDNGNLRFDGYGHKSISTFVRDVQKLLTSQTTIQILEKNRPTFKHSLVSTAVIEAVNESLINDSKWINLKLPISY